MATAIAETIIRFEGASEREIDESEIGDLAIFEITALALLLVTDLRTTGLLRLGISTDAPRPKENREGQKLSETLYAAFAVDGVLYSSRLTSPDCVAVYDRAVSIKPEATPAVNLIRHPDLIPTLSSIDVAIRKA